MVEAVSKVVPNDANSVEIGPHVVSDPAKSASQTNAGSKRPERSRVSKKIILKCAKARPEDGFELRIEQCSSKHATGPVRLGIQSLTESVEVNVL